eukprot:gene1850-991_t
MGILQFYQSLEKIFGERILDEYPPQTKQQMDHIYFDLNNLLYGIAMKAKTEDEFASLLMKKIIQTLKNYPAGTKTIFLAIDGPAPRAKLLTQRERRFKPSSASKFGKSTKKQFLINPLNFTPGTDFLNRLKQKLKEFCLNSLVFRLKYSNTKFFISGADCLGEGEFKIFEHMKTLNQTKSENILVVGSDSDLILFGMKNLKKKKIFILKEKDNLFNTFEIKHELLKRKKKGMENGSEHGNRTVDDFIFLTLLNGNDYFPKLKGINYVSTLENYLKSKKYLIHFNPIESTISIDWDFFFEILKVHDKKERVQDFRHPKALVGMIFSKTLGKNLVFKDELLASGGSKVEVYFNDKKIVEKIGTNKKDAHKKAAEQILNLLKQEEFLLKILPDHVKPSEMIDECERILDQISSPNDEETGEIVEVNFKELIQNYFEGVIWVLKYLSGECNDYSFYFKFDEFPVKKLIEERKDLQNRFKLEEKMTKPLPPSVFCMTLIPPKSIDLIPNESLKKFVMENENVKDLFHGKFSELQKQWNQQNSIERIQYQIQKSIEIEPNFQSNGMKFSSISKYEKFENQILNFILN